MWRRVWSSSGTFAGTMMAQESPMVSTRLPCPVGPTSSFSYSTATSSPPSSSSRLLLRSLNGILSLPLSSSQSSCVPWLGATRVPVPSSLQFWYWLELYEAPIFSVGSSMEKLALKSLSSQAKVGGTVLSIAGAFIVTFYKGQLLTVSSTLHLPPHSSWGPWWVLRCRRSTNDLIKLHFAGVHPQGLPRWC
ncbi:WAT1-related protein At3g28080-like isoform X2 [Punica granatum]|uniref:WAT1-related protein At3g28080-like isoform X2 n=1 Tax=Punica granatum TaxID=22663 RepID=A0A6P8DVD7_PUNGR|nr:WAT1-related protein At3g28080-like isoform X2 [Punica granatum]